MTRQVSFGEPLTRFRFEDYADFLDKFKWSHYLELTFDHRVSSSEAWHGFDRWKRELSRVENRRIQYFLVIERRYATDNPHLHVLLTGTEDVKTYKWQQRWFKTEGWASITPYDPKRGIRYYLAKKFAKREAEMAFSAGLFKAAKLASLPAGSQN